MQFYGSVTLDSVKIKAFKTAFPYNVPGWKKLYLIFGMCDESFAINSMTKVPDGVDRSWFMLFVTMLNHFYWVAGATLGAVVGSAINFTSEGIEFVLPALFLVIFAEQWLNADAHGAALTGLAASVLCLFVFCTENFMNYIRMRHDKILWLDV